SGGEIISPLSEIDVLAIDELGKGRGSQFEQETLDELIARRYNAGRTTLFGTNYSLAEPVERSQEGGYRDTQKSLAQASKESFFLKDRVGDRTYSRLLEMCEFVELPRETPDHRRVLADHSRTARP
ncbi:MAG: DNA replication protein, partial [Myxococcaceae bacterium]